MALPESVKQHFSSSYSNLWLWTISARNHALTYSCVVCPTQPSRGNYLHDLGVDLTFDTTMEIAGTMEAVTSQPAALMVTPSTPVSQGVHWVNRNILPGTSSNVNQQNCLTGVVEFTCETHQRLSLRCNLCSKVGRLSVVRKSQQNPNQLLSTAQFVQGERESSESPAGIETEFPFNNTSKRAEAHDASVIVLHIE